METFQNALWWLLPVALLGPAIALGLSRPRTAAALAFGPAVLYFGALVLAAHTHWGTQPAANSDDLENAGQMILFWMLFVAAGAVGFALAWLIKLIRHCAHRCSSRRMVVQ